MTRRTERVSRAVRNAVSEVILHDLHDPRKGFVTVTRAEVSPDLKTVTVFVSIIGTETEQRLTFAGLDHAAGFIRRQLAEKVEMKSTPRLVFRLDQGIKHSIRISELLRKAAEESGEQSSTT